MFELCRHAWKTISGYTTDHLSWGILTKRVYTEIQRCDHCGKLRKQKITVQ